MWTNIITLLVVSLIAGFLLTRRNRFGMPLWFQFVRKFWHFYAWMMHNIKVRGEFKLPEEGGCIVVANHTCGGDPVYMSVASPARVSFMVAKEMHKQFYIWPWSKMAGCIPVNRSGHDTASIRTVIRYLKQRRCVGIFPEGTINTSGELGPAKPGVALLALKSKAPIIPMYFHGTPISKSVPKPLVTRANVTVFIGEPFNLDFVPSETKSDKKKLDRAALQKASDKIMEEIHVLRDKAHAELGEPERAANPA